MSRPGFTAVVLAGGAGTRLRPLVSDRPKALAEIDGEPFLARLLDQLAAAGCRRAVLCTGHLGEQIERELGPLHDGIELRYSRETSPLGTGGALRHALPLLGDEHVLVANGDSYCDLDLRAFVAWAQENAVPAALVAADVPDTSRYGALELAAGDGGPAVRVLGFREKDGAGGRGPINAGIYWLHRGVLAMLPPRAPLSFERDALPLMAGARLVAWRTDAPFLDIGTPESFVAAPAFFAACARRRARDRKGLLVLDRDGTLIRERHYLADPAGVELLPGVVEGLRRFARRGYALAIVTNQSGIGRGLFDERALQAVNERLLAELAAAGVEVHGIWHCPHRPEENCACRKPEPLLLEQAMQQLGYAPEQCLVVGDKPCDIDLGRRVGARTALVRTGYGKATEQEGSCRPDLVVDGIAELAAQEVGA